MINFVRLCQGPYPSIQIHSSPLHHQLHRAGHVTGTVTRLKWLSEDTVNRPVGDSIQYKVAWTSLIYS